MPIMGLEATCFFGDEGEFRLQLGFGTYDFLFQLFFFNGGPTLDLLGCPWYLVTGL